MTALEIFWQQIDFARKNGDDTGMIFRRFSRARSKEPKQRPVMETFNWPRKHFMQLRDRHLHMVEEYGFRPEYNRDELRKYFLTNWSRLIRTFAKEQSNGGAFRSASEGAHGRAIVGAHRDAPR
jgi:hypothetical protein